jgi:hypothetical protein
MMNLMPRPRRLSYLCLYRTNRDIEKLPDIETTTSIAIRFVVHDNFHLAIDLVTSNPFEIRSMMK